MDRGKPWDKAPPRFLEISGMPKQTMLPETEVKCVPSADEQCFTWKKDLFYAVAAFHEKGLVSRCKELKVTYEVVDITEGEKGGIAEEGGKAKERVLYRGDLSKPQNVQYYFFGVPEFQFPGRYLLRFRAKCRKYKDIKACEYIVDVRDSRNRPMEDFFPRPWGLGEETGGAAAQDEAEEAEARPAKKQKTAAVGGRKAPKSKARAAAASAAEAVNEEESAREPEEEAKEAQEAQAEESVLGKRSRDKKKGPAAPKGRGKAAGGGKPPKAAAAVAAAGAAEQEQAKATAEAAAEAEAAAKAEAEAAAAADAGEAGAATEGKTEAAAAAAPAAAAEAEGETAATAATAAHEEPRGEEAAAVTTPASAALSNAPVEQEKEKEPEERKRAREEEESDDDEEDMALSSLKKKAKVPAGRKTTRAPLRVESESSEAAADSEADASDESEEEQAARKRGGAKGKSAKGKKAPPPSSKAKSKGKPKAKAEPAAAAATVAAAAAAAAADSDDMEVEGDKKEDGSEAADEEEEEEEGEEANDSSSGSKAKAKGGSSGGGSSKGKGKAGKHAGERERGEEEAAAAIVDEKGNPIVFKRRRQGAGPLPTDDDEPLTVESDSGELRVTLSPALKKVFLDDFAAVGRAQLLPDLPRKPSVSTILHVYRSRIRKDDHGGREFVIDLLTCFDGMLGHSLLYAAEVPQLEAKLKEDPSLRPRDLYGAEHLLRLLLLLPKLLLSPAQQHPEADAFLKKMGKNPKPPARLRLSPFHKAFLPKVAVLVSRLTEFLETYYDEFFVRRYIDPNAENAVSGDAPQDEAAEGGSVELGSGASEAAAAAAAAEPAKLAKKRKADSEAEAPALKRANPAGRRAARDAGTAEAEAVGNDAQQLANGRPRSCMELEEEGTGVAAIVEAALRLEMNGALNEKPAGEVLPGAAPAAAAAEQEVEAPASSEAAVEDTARTATSAAKEAPAAAAIEGRQEGSTEVVESNGTAGKPVSGETAKAGHAPSSGGGGHRGKGGAASAPNNGGGQAVASLPKAGCGSGVPEVASSALGGLFAIAEAAAAVAPAAPVDGKPAGVLASGGGGSSSDAAAAVAGATEAPRPADDVTAKGEANVPQATDATVAQPPGPVAN